MTEEQVHTQRVDGLQGLPPNGTLAVTLDTHPYDVGTKIEARSAAVARQLLILFLIVVGVLLIGASFFPVGPEFQTILRSLGLALAPAGIVALLLANFASTVTEMLLRDAVETTLRDTLQKDIGALRQSLDASMQEIGLVVHGEIEEIRHDMKGLSPLFSASSKLGLENVHLTRNSALSYFAWFLDAEAQKGERHEQARVWIVSSSIKGLLEAAADNFDGGHMMQKIAHCGCDLRIMMTDPKIADIRAKQERRADGEIPKEVEMNLAYLKRIGVNRESVRFYSGTPTVFAIATTDRMLLNPYPYQTEAFRCFSLIVQKTLNHEADIFHQYLNAHFEEPWKRTTEITPDYWTRL
jgi:hypothetical protein